VTTKIFVTVGTDHHPFARLVDWVDAWAEGRQDIDLLVQHGPAPASRVGRNRPFLGADELQRAYRSSDLVVAQVGPGSIADANGAGIVPIVVPRDPALGEVVDDHQFDFGAFMAAKGRAAVVTTREALHERLELALTRPEQHRLSVVPDPRGAASEVAALAQRLVAGPPARLSVRRVLAMLRSAGGVT